MVVLVIGVIGKLMRHRDLAVAVESSCLLESAQIDYDAVPVGLVCRRLWRVRELASSLTRNQVPRKGLGVRVPCPPLPLAVHSVHKV